MTDFILLIMLTLSFIGYGLYYISKGGKVKDESNKIKYFEQRFNSLIGEKENGMKVDEIRISPPHKLFHKNTWIVRKHMKSTNFFSSSTDIKEVFRIKDSELNQLEEYIKFSTFS